MIAGLVAITPAAGYINGLGALRTGLIASILVWLSWNKLSKTRPFRAVDDALGVVHTHSLFMSLRMPDAVEALTSAGEFRHPQDS
jgi:Amt family ammonium transporter